MNESKHTPEPWHWSGQGEIFAGRKMEFLIASVHRHGEIGDNDPVLQANGRRISACVNACKGIVDPEETVPELVAALRSIANQSIGDDWTLQQAFGYIRVTAKAALAKLEGGAK